MKGLVIAGGVVILGMIAALLFVPARDAIREPSDAPAPIAMKLSSSAFRHNEPIPAKYTCDGENVSPPLSISGAPQGTKGLVLIMDDPDAPRGTLRPGSGQAWVHWVVLNLDPATAEIAEGSTITAAQLGMTSFGKPGYGGPCPPSGTHRYFFKLYALDITLTLPPNAGAAELLAAMEGHAISQTELIGLYERGGATR